MKKIIFTIPTIIFLIFLLFPIDVFAQIDIWVNDDNLILDEFDAAEETVNLESFELFWSADTYTPLGYLGRALPAPNSFVTVEAELKISGANPKSLKYSWFLDGIFQESKSGYTKDSFTFGIRKFAGTNHTVLVKVFNESRSFLEEKSINIPVTNPEIVVYSKNGSPTNLPYLTSAQNFYVGNNEESSFLALPYFFSVKKISDLEFEWLLGEKSVKDSSYTANVVGLKIINKEVEGILEETLNLRVTNKLWTEQKLKKSIKLSIY